MEFNKAYAKRCLVYSDFSAAYQQRYVQPEPSFWWQEVPPAAVPSISTSPATNLNSYARPGNCILGHNILLGSSVSFYIAISYAWDPMPEWKRWQDRVTTEQALKLASRLSSHTSAPLWIDAICIPQNNELVKMQELAKMADIYRGASMILCLIPEITDDICQLIRKSMELMKDPSYIALQQTGDIFGGYMFATHGEDERLVQLFASRWWERAWTFQEAVLNPLTILVGDGEESIPIQDVLHLVEPIRRWTACNASDLTMGRSAGFWDSVAAMGDASQRRLPLGDAMSCVWRRQSKEKHDMVYSLLGVCRLSEMVRPDYEMPLMEVLVQLFESAVVSGDYSWISWCHAMQPGKGIVPRPEDIFAAPFVSITRWESIEVPTAAPILAGSQEGGVILPFRSTGVVRWESESQSVADMVQTLRSRKYSDGEIWDLLFGIRVGLCVDINRAVGITETSDISTPMLNSVLMMISGYLSITKDILDLRGDKPFTPNLGFTNYASMAAQTWRDSKLIALESQGGIVVVPEISEGSKRIYMLPIKPVKEEIRSSSRGSIRFAFVARDCDRFSTSATGLMVQTGGAGSGKWQLRRIS